MEKVLARFPTLTLTAQKSLLNDEDVNCAAANIVSLLNIDLNMAHFILSQVLQIMFYVFFVTHFKHKDAKAQIIFFFNNYFAHIEFRSLT